MNTPIPEADVRELQRLIASAEASLQEARELLAVMTGERDRGPSIAEQAQDVGRVDLAPDGKVIEGLFDGQNMAGPDGKMYSVPANYASKSKLVEGDRLKLTITNDGSFIYKQIGPIERQRLIGTLTKDEATNEYRVLAGDRSYRVLLASITYFKGDLNDQVVVLVPKGKSARWGAVENIIKAGSSELPTPPEVAHDDLERPA